MADQQQSRRGREGGRWINERPTSEEFAEWFTHSMNLDPALRHEDYIGGVVLIPAVDERAKQVTGFNAKGEPIIEQRPELSYIPYAKVETRVAYFWDLLDVHEEWIGVVEHVESERPPILSPLEELVETIVEAETGQEKTITRRKQQQAGAVTQMVNQLPVGFSLTSVPVGNAYTHFLCCTIRISIYRREEWQKSPGGAVPVRTGRGTKQVPLLTGRHQPYADANSLMKAETGALGRALGFAGIFVIPGSGVATAEDMMEAMSQGAPPAEAEAAPQSGPEAPQSAPVRTGAEQAAVSDEALQARARELWQGLQESSPDQATKFGAWMRERGHQNLNVTGAALRGVVRKLERLGEEATSVRPEDPSAASS